MFALNRVNANQQQRAAEREANMRNAASTQVGTQPPQNKPEEVDYFQLGLDSDYEDTTSQDTGKTGRRIIGALQNAWDEYLCNGM